MGARRLAGCRPATAAWRAPFSSCRTSYQPARPRVTAPPKRRCMADLLRLRAVALLHEGPDVLLLGRKTEPLECRGCGILRRHKRQRVLVLQQIGNLVERLVGLVMFAFDHVSAGCRAEMLEVCLAIRMRRFAWLLAAAPSAPSAARSRILAAPARKSRAAASSTLLL